MVDTLIISLGSTVMRDDAIGHHVLDKLIEQKINADMIKLDTDIFKLRLHYKEHKRLLILDALIGDYPPGTILVFSIDEINEHLKAKIRHAHAVGSIEALQIMRMQDGNLQNAEIFFIGIVAEVIDKGLSLSKSVQKAIPKTIEKIINLIT